MAVTFGWQPLELIVALAAGADFVFTLAADPPGWPDDITIELLFSTSQDVAATPTATWPATIDGDNATWDRPSADVDAVLTADAHYARLRYREADGSTLMWMAGTVRKVA